MVRRRKLPSVHEVAAIDPSLTATAVVVGTASGVVDYVNEHGSDPAGRRAVDRVKRCESLVGRILMSVGQAEVVFIEGYAYAAKGKSVYDLAEFGGILRDHLLAPRLDGRRKVVVEVAPSAIKKFATGSGVASKDKMLTTVVRTMDPTMRVDTNNKADAMALYMLGCAAVGDLLLPDLAKAKRKTVDDVTRLYLEARK